MGWVSLPLPGDDWTQSWGSKPITFRQATQMSPEEKSSGSNVLVNQVKEKKLDQPVGHNFCPSFRFDSMQPTLKTISKLQKFLGRAEKNDPPRKKWRRQNDFFSKGKLFSWAVSAALRTRRRRNLKFYNSSQSLDLLFLWLYVNGWNSKKNLKQNHC